MEELVWGDKDHKWVKAGVLQTRGPGQCLCFPHTCVPPFVSSTLDWASRKWMSRRVAKFKPGNGECYGV